MDLFFKTPNEAHFIEHHHWFHPSHVFQDEKLQEISVESINFSGDTNKVCVKVNKYKKQIETSYYVGVDWLTENKKAIYVQPKQIHNNEEYQTDYLAMLFHSFKYIHFIDEVELEQLFEIKWDKPVITIKQEQDLLTPLLIVLFLKTVKNIVRKGLKKSYYQVERNLYSKIKGKVEVGKSIKQNISKGKNLHTICRYEEYGLDGLENRILKKCLNFIQKYLSKNTIKNAQEDFNSINSVFINVSEEVNIHEIRSFKHNAFYKEYKQAISLAQTILRRFGYSIIHSDLNNKSTKIAIPPFWIDMSKLFEVYVLGLLKEKFGKDVIYQPQINRQKPDFLLKDSNQKMIIDAKYKPNWANKNITNDIRQLSGYARMKGVYKKLEMKLNNQIIDCLIIYPTQNQDGEKLIPDVLAQEKYKLNNYVQFYKIGIQIPQKTSNA